MSHAAHGTLPTMRHAKRASPVVARRAHVPQPHTKLKPKPRPKQEALKQCEWKLLKSLFPDNLDLTVTDTEFRRALGLLAGRIPSNGETPRVAGSKPQLHKPQLYQPRHQMRFATVLTCLLAAPAWPALRTELHFVAETRLAFKAVAEAGRRPLRSECAVCVRLAALKAGAGPK